MDRTRKEEVVASLRDALSAATLVVVTCPKGLTVAESTELRRRMREEGASFRVTKNRLTRRALEGTGFEALSGLFAGQTAIACSDDPVAAARAAVRFSEDNHKFVILGGGLDNRALDAAEIAALARLPSLDELRARIVGTIRTPAARIAAAVQAPGGQLARALAAYAGQEKEGAGQR